MPRGRRRTTKAQLTLIQMTTCTIAVVAAGVAFGVLAHVNNRRSTIQDLAGLAEAIAHNSEAALMFNIEEDGQRILRILHTRKSVSSAYLYDAKGSVFAFYAAEGQTPSAYTPPIEGAGHVFTDHGVRVYCPIVVKGEPLGTICIEDTLASVRDAARRNISALAIVMLGALLLAFITATKLQSIISKPILTLASTARHIAADSDYSRRAKSGGSEEILSLNAAFNEMLGVIQQRDRDLSNEIYVRQKAESEVRHHRDELEHIVAARTKELERANEDLRREIKEHERAERLLRRTLANLETTNGELERFAQVAAHDLQEPLRKMLTFSDRLCASFDGNIAPQSQDYLSRIVSSAKRMQRLVDDLLEFSRLARRRIVFQQVDLKEVTQRVVKELQPEIDATHATITVGDLPTIEAEKPHIRQLIRQLISNAIKFQRPDTPPNVEIVTGESSADTVMIYIRDNGIGFEQKYEARIFEIFQRLHAPQLYEGTGIGLAICKRITDVHRGSISVESAPDQGTTFTVSLPRTQTFDREQ
jgi:signal transduction histidine kinase